MKINKLFVLVLLASITSLENKKIWAQTKKIKPLQVGSFVPDISFKLANAAANSGKLSDFKDKTIILDFWATYCKSCIEEFQKMDSLQKRYPAKLKILLVNVKASDSKEKMENFFKRWKNTNPSFNLPTIINDTLLSLYFPQGTIPHDVWINGNREVIAITDQYQITSGNLATAIVNGSIDLPTKKDFFESKVFNPGEDGFTIDDNFKFYSVFKKGKIENQEAVDRSHFTVPKLDGSNSYGDNRGICMSNIPLLDIYKKALLLNRSLRNFDPNKRIIINKGDSACLVFDSKKYKIKDWEKENLYTYEIVVPAKEVDSLYKHIIADLNHYSDFIGTFETKKQKCLFLVRTSKIDKIKTKGGEYIADIELDRKINHVENIRISEFVMRLQDLPGIPFTIFDSTNYFGNIDLKLVADLKDINSIRKELKNYDLDLVEGVKEMDVFVITKRKS